MSLRVQFAGGRSEAARRITRVADVDNPNFDVVPTATDLVHTAIRKARMSVKRHRKGRAKLAAYSEGRCHASRGGLLEVAAQIEQLAESPEAARDELTQIELLARSDIYWECVVAVEEFTPEDEWVYDLCVD